MNPIPVVTIVGIPNTGKSTLYNRLQGQRRSLIHSLPGMTRDIIRGRAETSGKVYYIQDSGGFFPQKEQLAQEINSRILREVDHSDLVIFLFDGRRDLLGYEKDFYLQVKKRNSKLLAVINKVDHPDGYLLPESYYMLKSEFLLISAEHNLGIELLLEQIEKMVDLPFANAHPPERSPRITIVGKPNVGKSSIVNRLLCDEWVIVSPKPGTTRDSIDLEIRRNQQLFTIIDNAGIRKLQKVKEGTESAAVIRAEKYMRQADIVAFVIDLSRPLDQNDFLIAKKIVQAAKPVIITGNKWDLLGNEEKKKNIAVQIKGLFHQLYFAPFLAVSALNGKNIYALIDMAEAIYERIQEKVKVKKLNEVLQSILSSRRIYTIEKRPFAPKFASIEDQDPFFIVFHGRQGQVGRLRVEDEFYLKKALNRELELQGIPIYFKISLS